MVLGTGVTWRRSRCAAWPRITVPTCSPSARWSTRCSGRRAFRGDTPMDAMMAVAREEVPPLARPDVPALARADRRTLPREGSRRPLSVDARPRLRARQPDSHGVVGDECAAGRRSGGQASPGAAGVALVAGRHCTRCHRDGARGHRAPAGGHAEGGRPDVAIHRRNLPPARCLVRAAVVFGALRRIAGGSSGSNCCPMGGRSSC